MRHANWSRCYQRLCNAIATARGLDTAHCELLVNTSHILQQTTLYLRTVISFTERKLVCVCVCVRRYCTMLHVAFLNRRVTCCVTNCVPAYYLGKKMSKSTATRNIQHLFGLIPPIHIAGVQNDRCISDHTLPDKKQHSQQTNIHAPRWDSNPRSQQASGRRPTP